MVAKTSISDSNGRELFIVDNSVYGWTGLRYLEEWCGISKGFDIATGFFEIGALLALDGKWQNLEKIRILMGSEMTHRTRKLLLEAVKATIAKALDESLEQQKTPNPFLSRVQAIIDGLKTGQIECRVYDKDKFHAKAYITHAKMAVIGSQALVGSSNFTKPGLTENIELNVQIQSAREVAQLQEWFEIHWADAIEITDAVIEVITKHVREYSPFEVYAKALQEYFRGHELTASEWDETRSKMFPKLDRYQKEAYWALLKIARQHGGAFLCDGVGLGKTFVGLMLIERLVLHENKRVVLFAPKAARESVWEPHLKEWLSHIGGGADFSNLAVFSHTDLGRKGEFPERFKRLAELADAVIIDEAHHFRNPGREGNGDDIEPSRYFRLFGMLDESARSKTVFLLTATPINNRLTDFRHLAELFTRKDPGYFARTLGVNNFVAHFGQLERELRKRFDHDVTDVAEHMGEAEEILSKDTVFKNLVVQRSRAYARESQLRETGAAAVFPERKPPIVAEYSIRATYGKLLDMFENAFTRQNPLFTLPMYYPLAWYKGDDDSIDPFDQNRQKQVVGLIRTNFLKRFESSVAAFEVSCERLLQKLLAFVEVHSESDGQQKKLERWKAGNADALGYAVQHQRDLWGEEDDDLDEGDIIPSELLEATVRLDSEDYDIPEMLTETYRDLDQLVHFIEEARRFQPRHDDKLKKLIRLLGTKELAGQKVLIFTEFADTARYLKRELERAEIVGVAQVDSATKGSRSDYIKRFSPYYNGTSSGELAAQGKKEIRVLISTDVLSEGLNLQDASRMINYDIHWNPVRLMQRIGRVDRRMNPAVEERLISDHPDVKPSRGKVSFWNFLPPDELNEILTLYSKVTQKTLLISKTLGIEGRKLLTPEDDFDALREFNQAYEGTKTDVEEMHLEYQSLLQADPSLEAKLAGFPGSIFSGRRKTRVGGDAVFFCYALPALDKDFGEFTESAGTVKWYLYQLTTRDIRDDAGEIVANVRSDTEVPRHCEIVPQMLMDARKKIEQHIKSTYLKRVDAPVGVKPVLKCWMELNGG